jgi:hypothetical protein
MIIDKLIMSNKYYIVFSCSSLMYYVELSIPQENKEKCLEAVPGLVLMLKSDDPKNQNIAARAISNISNSANTKIPIIEQGVLPPLIALLEKEDDGAKDGAILALMYISNAPETKCLVVEGGILPPLFALLEYSVEAIKENAISILASLVLMEANHVPMIQACSFAVLLNGISTGTASFRERCIFIVSTLSYATLSRQALVVAGVVQVFKPLLEKEVGSQFSKELAVALFANICHVKTAQVQIVNEGVVPLLMQVAQSESADKSDMKQRVGWVLQNVRHLVIRKTTPSETFLPPPPPPPSSTKETVHNPDSSATSSDQPETFCSDDTADSKTKTIVDTSIIESGVENISVQTHGVVNEKSDAIPEREEHL